MPVQTPHPEYAYRKADWQKIRCFAEGSRAVKRAGETYLPRISGQTDEEYNAYKCRAEVYGAIDRTIDGLEGAVFLKSPQVKLPGGDAEALADDVTLAGNTMIEWLRTCAHDVITVGRFGVLIDFSGPQPTKQEAGAETRPQVAVGANRPYLVTYSAEQIINWDTAVIGGKTKLTLVVLEEKGWVQAANDPFAKVMQTTYRVLRLEQGKYVVERWTPKAPQQTSSPGGSASNSAASPEFEVTATSQPTRRGELLTEIPFFFFGVTGQSIAPEKPPLLDVADLCHLHYMQSADYAHGLHWVALPTPWATGVSERDKIGVGPTTAITIGDPNAKVGMLEFTGQGLTAIEKRLAELEKKMAILGARILEEQKREAETAEAMKIRQGGDASVLAGISDATSRAAEAVIARMLWWNGDDTEKPDVTIELNMDFVLARMAAEDLLALLQARQAGQISQDTFLYNLKRGQILAEDVTVEDEKAKLETEPPPLPEGAGGAGGGGGQ